LIIAALTGCANTSSLEPSQPVPSSSSVPGATPSVSSSRALPSPTDRVIARNERFVIYNARRGDTLRSLALEYLGDETRYWEIADFNGVKHTEPDQVLVIPLKPINPLGVSSVGYQLVPILAYHRFGPQASKMEVTAELFAAQLNYLAENDYRVVRLRDLEDFLNGKRPLPNRAVVITIDDGYASTYEYAFPLLQQHGFAATVFLYTDFVGAKDALTWTQMREMVASGLIDIQAHSKTHANLSYRLPGESDEHYRERLDLEARVPRDVLERKLPVKVDAFAYPYGDPSEVLIELLRKRGYQLALTVNPGANPFFADPLLLQRSMVLGDQDLDTFKARLQIYREMDLR
jgi:peptidoglycan/xylan/chitin deacetylase (PgdA/CDA1 family)